jgi:ADP-ribosyltransferase exoenzyme
MCYKKPGPRCSSHAALRVQQLKIKMRSLTLEETQKDPDLRYKLKDLLTEAEKEYDATPAGMLDLKRRILTENFDTEYTDRLNYARALRQEKLALLKQQDDGDLSHDEPLSSPSIEHFHQEFLADNEIRRGWSRRDHDEESQKFLQSIVEHSHTWVSKLTAEETEAISWLTANGFSVIREHLAGREHDIWGHDVYSRESVERAIELCDSAYEKTPQLESPIVVYRGLGSWHFDEKYQSFEDVQKEFVVGETFEPDTYLSASASPQIANGFATGGVCLEIKTTRMPSPVNVSAWGHAEAEVTIPRKSKFRITKVIDKVGYNSTMDNIVVQMEEITD